MIDLLLCILLTTYLVICLKAFEKFGINSFQAIVFNYIVCVATGSIYNGSVPDYADSFKQTWFYYAVFIGTSFFGLFIVMDYVTRKISATVTSVAGKLSMVIPVTAAFFLYNEPVTFLKIVGVALALVSVVLSSLKEDKSSHKITWRYLFMPFVLFIGSGINDTLSKYCQANFLSPETFATFNIIVFSAAAVTGIISLSVFILVRQRRIEVKSILAGIILGVPNFFSLQYLLKALNTGGWDSSIIFPINNIGVVAATSIFAFILFNEKLSKINLAGLALAFIAIGFMFF